MFSPTVNRYPTVLTQTSDLTCKDFLTQLFRTSPKWLKSLPIFSKTINLMLRLILSAFQGNPTRISHTNSPKAPPRPANTSKTFPQPVGSISAVKGSIWIQFFPDTLEPTLKIPKKYKKQQPTTHNLCLKTDKVSLSDSGVQTRIFIIMRRVLYPLLQLLAL